MKEINIGAIAGFGMVAHLSADVHAVAATPHGGIVVMSGDIHDLNEDGIFERDYRKFNLWYENNHDPMDFNPNFLHVVVINNEIDNLNLVIEELQKNGLNIVLVENARNLPKEMASCVVHSHATMLDSTIFELKNIGSKEFKKMELFDRQEEFFKKLNKPNKRDIFKRR